MCVCVSILLANDTRLNSLLSIVIIAGKTAGQYEVEHSEHTAGAAGAKAKPVADKGAGANGLVKGEGWAATATVTPHQTTATVTPHQTTQTTTTPPPAVASGFAPSPLPASPARAAASTPASSAVIRCASNGKELCEDEVGESEGERGEVCESALVVMKACHTHESIVAHI